MENVWFAGGHNNLIYRHGKMNLCLATNSFTFFRRHPCTPNHAPLRRGGVQRSCTFFVHVRFFLSFAFSVKNMQPFFPLPLCGRWANFPVGSGAKCTSLTMHLAEVKKRQRRRHLFSCSKKVDDVLVGVCHRTSKIANRFARV